MDRWIGKAHDCVAHHASSNPPVYTFIMTPQAAQRATARSVLAVLDSAMSKTCLGDALLGSGVSLQCAGNARRCRSSAKCNRASSTPPSCNFLFVRDFSTSAASLNGLPMGVEDACARETRVATKAYDLWIATGNPDATYNWYRAVRRTGLHIPGVQPPAVFFC